MQKTKAYSSAGRDEKSLLAIRPIENMDIKRSDLPLLVSLEALLSERNVTRAAHKLHISQPTLSGHLAKLRQLFGDPLLVPSETGRGMVPTDRARALQVRLSDALLQLHLAVTEKDTFDPATSRRTFVIAANDNVFSILGLEVLGQVLSLGNPELRIAVVPATDPRLTEKMAHGEIDLYLGDVAYVSETLKARFLLSDTFAFAQRKRHPRGLAPPSLDEYCALPRVVVSARADFSTHVDDVLAELSRDRKVAVTIPTYGQVALVLAQSNAVASLPRQLLQRYASVIDILELPFAMPAFRLSMAWHSRTQNDPGAIWLRERFMASARENPGQGCLNG